MASERHRNKGFQPPPEQLSVRSPPVSAPLLRFAPRPEGAREPTRATNGSRGALRMVKLSARQLRVELDPLVVGLRVVWRESGEMWHGSESIRGPPGAGFG